MISVRDKIFNSYNREEKDLKKNTFKNVLNLFDNVQNNIKTINIVGTNGKGTVSNYLSIGLKQNYKKVGLFISPAFLYHNERIQINNIPISDDDLIKYINKTKKIVDEYKLNFFEIWTLIGILYFNDNNIDIAVIEAGIGGLFDTTSFFTNQIATLVTSISHDHENILGNTIEKIIYQKINIVKDNSKLFISNDNYKYKNIIENQLINKNIDIIFSKKNNDEDFIYYQRNNIELVKLFLKSLNIINFDFIKNYQILGRYTKLNYNGNKIILDGAHNIDGIKKLIKTVNDNKYIVLYASSNEKEHLKILNELTSFFKDVYICEFEHEKSWKINNIEYKNKVENWINFLNKYENKNILICGSLYFIPLVYEYIKIRS